VKHSHRDRRGNGRVPHGGSVLVRGLAKTFGRGTACDFTEDGARLLVKEPVKPGCPIILHLQLEAQRVLSLIATVVWASPSESGTEVGVRFQEGCRTSRQYLDNWLHRKRLLSFA